MQSIGKNSSEKLEKAGTSKTEARKNARRILKQARRAVQKIGKRQVSGRVAIRLKLAKAVQMARRIQKQAVFRKALKDLAKKHDLKQRKKLASPYLLLLRFLRLDPKSGSTTRHAQVIEMLVDKEWSNRKTRQRLLKFGPTHFLNKKGGES
jgi:5-formyltetrahydrofolate cyclo-ligase